jgi:subtilisin family serine protease
VKKWLRVAGLLSVFLLLAISLAVAAPKDQSQPYLVSLVPGASAQSIVGPGVTLVSDWANIQAAQVMATPSAAAQLAKNPNVEYVEQDYPRKALSMSYADGDLTWGLQAVKAQEAWNLGVTGQGVKVCVLDTGIDPNHPEFTRPDGTSVIAGAENFTSSPTTFSVHPHGTHVSGTIAGQTNASGSKIGVAPGVQLYMAKVLGDDGYGETAWVINGLRWCQAQGANIASLSLGSDHASGVESKAFLDAWKSGMLIVAAAGNDGNNKISYPAGYEPVISVAAVDSKLNQASFSQFNSDVEVAAPGVATLSSVPVDTGLIIGLTVGDQSYAAGSVEYAPATSVTAPLVECGIADTTTSCTGIPASGEWTALIKRGSISFAQKVTNVMAQGASAAIITNNDAANPDDVGSFTLGTAGAWIPTISVSYNSGAAIRAGGLGTGSITFTPWNYDYYQGTSMATPHAAAVAALAWSANPSLTNQQVRAILDGTALHLGKEHGRNFQYGYGLVQADAAVQAAWQQ